MTDQPFTISDENAALCARTLTPDQEKEPSFA